MTSPKILLTLAGLLAITIVATGCGGTKDPDVDRGRTLFIENCGNCHTLAQAGTSAEVGPNLDHTYSAARAAGMTDKTIEGVVVPQVLHPRPSTENPTVSMPAEIVTGRDLDDVAAYVGRWAGVPGAAPPQVEGGPGAQVFADNGCGGCHQLAAAGSTGTTGPNLDEALTGQSADQVTESIVDPNAQVASGYQPGIMPSYQDTLSEQELNQLVEYLLESVGGGSN